MEDGFKNKVGLILFIIIVLSLSIGGYFFTKNTLKEEDNKIENNEIKSVKINEDEDYIYFENDEEISSKAEIEYKDVVINIKGSESITDALRAENTVYKESIKYISDMDILSNEIINYNNDNIYTLSYRKYDSYETINYLSLLVSDYTYSCFDLSSFAKVKSYIFDLTDGTLLSDEDVLKRYNLTMDEVLDKVKTYLESKQENVDGNELIKIDETINNFNNYGFFIENGVLKISFLVKSNQVDYNEVMEVK